MPIIALGLRLKASMKDCLNAFGVAAYMESPASPAELMNTLPIRLYLIIRSFACLRLVELWMLLRQDAVLDIDHPFFLADRRWH